MKKLTFHLIPNAHLDPVWLWDWREGMNEGISMCRTMVRMLEDYPMLTFIRGEAAVYEHVEKNDPETFEKILKLIDEGRWDVVGGTYVQPDTNLPATEVFYRHYERGLHYFRQRLGRKVEVAWAADSFGHSAGIPEIMAAHGIKGFCFTRPYPQDFKLEKPAFWWEGPGGSKILCYRPEGGWYGCERDEMPRRLDENLKKASERDLQNVGVWFGMGNHGGGSTRRQIEDILRWQEAHPDVEVVFSGLHRFIGALREENEASGGKLLPTFKGELNFCLRGCHVSAAKFKFLYRRTENALLRAEKTSTIIRAALGKKPKRKLDQAWDDVMFNSFHDILPGSSIEAAYNDQIPWTGGAFHQAQKTEFDALNQLAAEVDTAVEPRSDDHPTLMPVLLWNPHPYAFKGHVEFEICLDWRPLFGYRGRTMEVPHQVLDADGKPLPFQLLECAHLFFLNDRWRSRLLVPVEIPAGGYKVIQAGWLEGAKNAKRKHRAVSGFQNGGHVHIQSEDLAAGAHVGAAGIYLNYKGRNLLGDLGLNFKTFEDTWGSWGGLFEEPGSESISKVLHLWHVTEAKLLETGPERATFWVRLLAGFSGIDLHVSINAERDAADVHARVFWNERAARLKMCLPFGTRDEFEVPGGTVVRGEVGESCGGRWVRLMAEDGATLGFASDALYGFDRRDGEFRASIVRSTRYASSDRIEVGELPWRPVMDQGEHVFRFTLAPEAGDLWQFSDELEQPVVVQCVPPSPGKLPREGSFFELQKPSALRVNTLTASVDNEHVELHAQALTGDTLPVNATWLGKKVKLGPLPGRTLAALAIPSLKEKKKRVKK